MINNQKEMMLDILLLGETKCQCGGSIELMYDLENKYFLWCCNDCDYIERDVSGEEMEA